MPIPSARFGGDVLVISDFDDVKRDDLEYDHPVTYGPIPKECISHHAD